MTDLEHVADRLAAGTPCTIASAGRLESDAGRRTPGPDRRRSDSARGSAAAHRALAMRFGDARDELPRDADGCRVWPRGVSGSITHGHGLALAAVADARLALSVGIDLERVIPRRASLLPRVAGPAAIPGTSAEVATTWFVVREAVFKCAFPVTRRHRDWRDFSVDIDPDTGTFASDAGDGHGSLRGRYLAIADLVAAVAWWARPENGAGDAPVTRSRREGSRGTPRSGPAA